MPYGKKVIDHFENPRNIGSFEKQEEGVGTGVVGAPECGDVMKLQLKIVIAHTCATCQHQWDTLTQEASCPACSGTAISIAEVVRDARFKTFGCGSAIASSSYVTELIKGKSVADALEIKNTHIVEELSLPPVKIHCSVLAEDAIKAALADWKKKQEKK